MPCAVIVNNAKLCAQLALFIYHVISPTAGGGGLGRVESKSSRVQVESSPSRVESKSNEAKPSWTWRQADGAARIHLFPTFRTGLHNVTSTDGPSARETPGSQLCMFIHQDIVIDRALGELGI